jgi:UDP-N-acetylglucosamine 2-epimerase (non-hydrolysing)
MAPVIAALRQCPYVESRVLVSGQHRGLLDDTLSQFGITADDDLNLMEPAQSLGRLTGNAFTKFDAVLRSLKPDLVLAQGDTTTVMVAAMSCFYQEIPFGHVEAGLRTGEKRNPFPEEINRVIVGRVADLHFAPTARAAAALVEEGVDRKVIHLTGNTVIDNLATYGASLKAAAGDEQERLILLTSHRRENFGAPMRGALQAVRDVVEADRSVRVIYPVHPNPEVQAAAQEILGGHDRVELRGPMGFFDFMRLLKSAYLIVTDSGGVQEEAPWFSKPVLVLREQTERPEAVEAGVAELIGLDQARIKRRLLELLQNESAYKAMARSCSPYGDGQASLRIVEHVCVFLGHLPHAVIPPFKVETD